MAFKALPYSTLNFILFVSRLLLKLHKNQTKALKRTLSNTHPHPHPPHLKPPTPFSLSTTSNLHQKTLIFDVEGTLLRSSSLFPYFMLVAFEAGSLIRAFVLSALYPFVCLVSEEMGLKVMVMVSFFGVKKDGFRVGRSVLPKFFMEGVGMEGFEVFEKGFKRVGVSRLPEVMVEGFLKDYLGFEYVFGRELVVFGGYFVGVMKGNERDVECRLNAVVDGGDVKVCYSNRAVKHEWTSCSKEVYVVSDNEKQVWQPLPTQRYPKPLIFHDGRLAFRPDPITMLATFIWFPFAMVLSICRTIIALSLPYGALLPILSFTGMQLRLSNHNSTDNPTHDHNHHKGLLYVCNHRTLLDPLYLSFGLKKPVSAVTYSLSRLSEIISPIKTVRLTRDRDQDAKTMDKMLRQGDLVVCPEGTTCREPYLLRFSPLFAEMTDRIVPVALDTHVSMFYGTTAGGLKCLDPFLFMMNPCPIYCVRFLEMVNGIPASGGASSKRSFDIANFVQREIAKTVEFKCTKLTRKDKYLVLAGNEGIVSDQSNSVSDVKSRSK